MAEYVCRGIGVLANLLNPDAVYIGGGISLSDDLLFDLIDSKKAKHLLPANADIQIKPSRFGEQATSIGAVSLVLQKIMNLELSEQQ